MKLLCAVLALAAAAAFATPAAADDDDRFTITPYIWLPTIEGEFKYNIPPGAGGSPIVEVGPVDYLDSLNGALMIAGEARFDNFSLFTDVIWFDFSNENASLRSVTGPGGVEIPIDVGSAADLSAIVWTLAGGLVVMDEENYSVQPFVGLRYSGVDSDFAWSLAGPLNQFPQTGSISGESDFWDGIVGVRGEWRASEHWIFPYYVDVGAGDSDLTWQAMAGVSYRFGWGDLRLVYRHLDYTQDDEALVQELSLSGPAFGASFRF